MQASVEDSYGNVVTTASGTVSVAFASNPTGATLGGTTSVTASSGVASFTNLTINKTGSGYTLRVSSTGLTSATSHPIKVTRSGSAPSQLDPSTAANAADLSLGCWCWTVQMFGTAYDSRSDHGRSDEARGDS